MEFVVAEKEGNQTIQSHLLFKWFLEGVNVSTVEADMSCPGLEKYQNIIVQHAYIAILLDKNTEISKTRIAKLMATF